MAVNYCKLLGFQGSIDASVKAYKQTDVYQVRCDTPTDGKAVAVTGPGIAIGDLLAGQVFVFCERIQCEAEAGSSTVFTVKVHYSTPKNNQKLKANPLLRPPNVIFSGVAVREQVYYDINGNGIINSAGVHYDPSLERIFFDESIVIRVNQATVNTETLAQYRGAINSDTIDMTLPDGSTRTFVPFSMRLADAETEWSYENGVGFWKSVYKLDCRYRVSGGNTINWNPTVADRGTGHLDAAGVYVNNVDKHGRVVSAPQLLDGHGHLLANPSATNAVLQTYDVDPQLPFATILTF